METSSHNRPHVLLGSSICSDFSSSDSHCFGDVAKYRKEWNNNKTICDFERKTKQAQINLIASYVANTILPITEDLDKSKE